MPFSFVDQYLDMYCPDHHGNWHSVHMLVPRNGADSDEDGPALHRVFVALCPECAKIRVEKETPIPDWGISSLKVGASEYAASRDALDWIEWRRIF